MSENLTVDRSSLPPHLLEWLEKDQQKKGVILYREENEQVVLERLENVDPAMLARVRGDIERYRSVLERLAES